MVAPCAHVSAVGHAQKMTDITVHVVKNWLSSPHFVALENGHWVDLGLNVQIKLTSGRRNAVEALEAAETQSGTSRSAARCQSRARLRHRANMLILLDDGMGCASITKAPLLDDDTVRSR